MYEKKSGNKKQRCDWEGGRAPRPNNSKADGEH